METVEVVIRIPKRTYDRVSERGIIAFGDDAYYIGHAIADGTVLPKGHGRLIDADQLMNYCQNQIDGHKYADCNVIARFPIVLNAEMLERMPHIIPFEEDWR